MLPYAPCSASGHELVDPLFAAVAPPCGPGSPPTAAPHLTHRIHSFCPVFKKSHDASLILTNARYFVNMMTTHLQSEIDALNGQTRELASLVLNQVRRAADAAATGDATAAETVSGNEDNVSQRLTRIEEECLNILPLCGQSATGLRSVFDVARVNRELGRIGTLAKAIAHQSGVLAQGGLPATARDIVLLAGLATASCTRTIDAVLSRAADAPHAALEDLATIDGIRDRLSTRFEEALRQPGRPAQALLAGLAVVASLVQIGDHTTRIARVMAGL